MAAGASRCARVATFGILELTMMLRAEMAPVAIVLLGRRMRSRPTATAMPIPTR